MNERVEHGECAYLVVGHTGGDFPIRERWHVLALYADSDAALACAQRVMAKQDPQNPLAYTKIKVSPIRLNEAPLELQRP